MTTAQPKISIKDLKAASPRWCQNCGDYGALVGIRKFMFNQQLDPAHTVNISGIGCSGRMPHYINTYGFHGIHGRAIPIAMGVALARPDINLFIESGDGDALSIGANHLVHGINKNFNCVFILLDNQIYGLTKNQSSPTTRQGHNTNTQPQGTWIEPVNPVQFALGIGCSFVASTADWLGDHFVDTITKAFNHKGFSFVHVAQTCPKFNPDAWDNEASDWYDFLVHSTGVTADTKKGGSAGLVEHDPTNLGQAFQYSQDPRKKFGLFYINESRASYDQILLAARDATPKKDRSKLFDSYRI
jgi:2-oxoglutarate/2-oxoacid ferredoxin oxidoreductase subunit beta